MKKILFTAIFINLTICHGFDEKKHIENIGQINEKETLLNKTISVRPIESDSLPPLTGAKTNIADSTTKDELGLTNPCDRKIPTDILEQLTFPSNLAGSKEGVYYLANIHNFSEIFYLRSADSTPERLTFLKTNIYKFKLNSSGDKILLISGNNNSVIQLLDLKNRKVEPIIRTNKFINNIVWHPNSKAFFFTSFNETSNGTYFESFDLVEKKSSILAHISELVNVDDISSNGRFLSFTVIYSNEKRKVLVWDYEKRTLFWLDFKNMNTEKAFFTLDNKHIFFLGNDFNGSNKLYLHKLKTKTTKKVLDLNFEVEHFSLSKNKKKLFLLINENGYSKINSFEIDASGTKVKLLPVPKFDGAITSIDWDNDGSGFYYVFSSSFTPPNIWYWKEQKNIPWTKIIFELASLRCLEKEKLVTYPSFDKKEIPAFLYKTDKNLPYIFYVHDGPYEQFRPKFNAIVTFFLERGFGLFAANYRGSSLYNNEYASMDNKKRREHAVNDIAAGVKWLRDKGYKKIFFYAKGYGGWLVFHSLKKVNGVPAALYNGILDLNIFIDTECCFKRLIETEFGEKEIINSLQNKLNSSKMLEQGKTPLLLYSDTANKEKVFSIHNNAFEIKKLSNELNFAKEAILFFEKK